MLRETCDEADAENVPLEHLEKEKRDGHKAGARLGSPARHRFGTVGAVALDRQGNLAAGTSTGGTSFKYPGRVGDSAMIGCGCYADNLSGAVSCTGHGESIMKVVMAKTAADFIAKGDSPQAAADAAVRLLSQRTSGQGGLIVIDRQGRIGASFSTPDMAWMGRNS